MTDQKIIQELKKGNQRVFKHLYEYYPIIASMVTNNNGSEDDAKDIFQNALLVFYKKAVQPDFKLTSKISTYLYGVSHNLWMKRITRDKSRHHSDLEAVKHVSGEEKLFEIQEQKKVSLRVFIKEQLDKIGDPCKSLLLMHEYEKLSWAEISEHLGYANEHTARQQKYKCIQRLRKMIPSNAKEIYLAT